MNIETELLTRIRRDADTIADRIRRVAEDYPGDEAQLALACDGFFSDFARRSGVNWNPHGERRVVWKTEEGKKAGRIDRLFNQVVVEYKGSGKLYDNNDAAFNARVLKQIRSYLDGLIKTEGWKASFLAGVVTDGARMIFCRYNKPSPTVKEQWIEEAPVPVDGASVARFLRLLLSFQREPLLPDPIVKRFGAQATDTTIATVRAFYDALREPQHPLTPCLYQQWLDFFADIAGLDPDRLKDKKELMKFARSVLQRQEPDPPRLLFALYSYSALLIKLLAVSAVTPFLEDKVSDRLAQWTSLPDDVLINRLRDMESGAHFRRLGISNFTEGDFFRWYVDEWTPEIARQVKKVLSKLAEFDPNAVEQAPERVRDLLKRLYHGLFPREVRHDLGEYYPPDWLAERLLAQVAGDFFRTESPGDRSSDRARKELARRMLKSRFTDPSCGSGTFVVLIIRRVRELLRQAGLPDREVLRFVRENLVGAPRKRTES